MKDFIEIRGAAEHNLKGFDLNIPRNKLVVITGVSGSGKSSLAFDTLYAEGQRRYVESLSAYARQFLEQMPKPNVESIDGLSPAIAIEQKNTSNNPRSTVGTVTEIHDYLRLLFARIGAPHCWICGRAIASMTIGQMADAIMQKDGARMILYAPVVTGRKGEYAKQIENLAKDGFTRIRINGVTYDIEETPKLDKNKKHTIDVVIDRLVIKDGIRQRLAESIETALKLSGGILLVEEKDKGETLFSGNFSCPICNVSYPEISPRMFSFNNPHGACPDCMGLGAMLEVDPELVVPNPSLSILDGAIEPWGVPPGKWYTRALKRLARDAGIDPKTPFDKLTKLEQEMVLNGNHRHEGVIPNILRRMKDTETGDIQEHIHRYLSYRTCPACSGSRLRKESMSVLVNGKNIHEISLMSVDELIVFFDTLKLTEKDAQIAARLIKEIRARLGFLTSVGIGYLSLERQAGTLSSGEAQRIRLATQIGSALTGVMYILDEPSIGLHQRDNERLIHTLKHLRDLGNTVIVVEHDEETMLEADHVIDMGPGAGELGGYIVCEGTPDKLKDCPESLTGKYITGKLTIHVPDERKKPSRGFLKVTEASTNNLKGVNVDIPLGVFTCITGVSGSGKSSLIIDTLCPYLEASISRSKLNRFKVKNITGAELIDKVINIDQGPIGRTPRSNPATYTGLFTFIRELFTLLPEARMRGYQAGRFSFNVKGGRCEACHGEGLIKIEMHFLPDVYVVCDQCSGKRFNDETLSIKYKGKNINDVLNMTVHEAYLFFDAIPKVKRKLQTLMDVGMDYIRLGQSATTLSGGEAQRTKLSRELSKRSTGSTVYILDEPTTGLHFDDINKLLKVLHRLTGEGNTVIVIEHNMDVIKSADYIIDLGPEGGAGGGKIIGTGTPEEIVKIKKSHTGRFLKHYLDRGY